MKRLSRAQIELAKPDTMFYPCEDVVECITKLEHLLKHRDGGSHDADCKSNYYPGICNCGHDAVAKYFEEDQ